MHGHVVDADIADKPHADQKGDATGTAITDEGGGQPCCGEESADNANVNECLEGDENTYALANQHADAINA